MLFAFLSFLALALAPLATPTAAAANAKPCSAAMISEHGSHGQMQTDHDAQGHVDLCCVGMASALPAESMASTDSPEAKPLLSASPITKLSGIRPAASDPPPRA